MALYFSPPVAALVPMAVKPSHPGYPLFHHYRNLDAGINVFVVGGVVTTVEPEYEFVTPEKVYLGGHIYTLTTAEAAVLTAAGYTVIGGPDEVVQPGLPSYDDGSTDPNLPANPGLVNEAYGVGFMPLGFGPLGGAPLPVAQPPAVPVDSGLQTLGVGKSMLGIASLGGQ